MPLPSGQQAHDVPQMMNYFDLTLGSLSLLGLVEDEPIDQRSAAEIFDGNAAVLLSSVSIPPFLYWHTPSLALPYRLLLCSTAPSIDQFQNTF